jgi:hypothetical protein
MSDGAATSSVQVMLPNGERIPFTVTAPTTISDLIDSLGQRGVVPANRSVVLIYRGRIFQPQDVVVSLDSLDQFTIHALFRADRAAGVAGDGAATDLRGFDRLARMNYSPQQIAQLRDNFHAMRGTRQARAEARMEAEEEWFPVLFNNDNPVQVLQQPEAPPAPDGLEPIAGEEPYVLDRYPRVKFGLGVFLGALFGIAGLVFMFMPRSDTTLFGGLFLGGCLHYGISAYNSWPERRAAIAGAGKGLMTVRDRSGSTSKTARIERHDSQYLIGDASMGTAQPDREWNSFESQHDDSWLATGAASGPCRSTSHNRRREQDIVSDRSATRKRGSARVVPAFRCLLE